MLLIGAGVYFIAAGGTADGIRFPECTLYLPMPAPKPLISGMETMIYEQELRKACRMAGRIIADPFYARLFPEEERGKFISLPHRSLFGALLS